jgi:short-subunit dehydrogenase
MPATKSILITGCSAEGIGAALALVLAQRGHHACVTARNVDKIPDTLKNLSNVHVSDP